MRNTASLSEVIQPDADPLTPSAQLVALPTATTAAVVPGVVSNLHAAFNMTTTSGNDQGTAKQNRTEQTKAQKQEKHTRTDKALSAEQAADFGMWQQSSAAPAC